MKKLIIETLALLVSIAAIICTVYFGFTLLVAIASFQGNHLFVGLLAVILSFTGILLFNYLNKIK